MGVQKAYMLGACNRRKESGANKTLCEAGNAAAIASTLERLYHWEDYIIASSGITCIPCILYRRSYIIQE